MTKEKIINGCEFQNRCIEYKDISYLKVMPICAIYELSIACHDKENKCKYYQVYKQIKHLKQKNEKLKKILQELEDLSLKTYAVADFQMYFDNLRGKNND